MARSQSLFFVFWQTGILDEVDFQLHIGALNDVLSVSEDVVNHQIKVSITDPETAAY